MGRVGYLKMRNGEQDHVTAHCHKTPLAETTYKSLPTTLLHVFSSPLPIVPTAETGVSNTAIFFASYKQERVAARDVIPTMILVTTEREGMPPAERQQNGRDWRRPSIELWLAGSTIAGRWSLRKGRSRREEGVEKMG